MHYIDLADIIFHDCWENALFIHAAYIDARGFSTMCVLDVAFQNIETLFHDFAINHLSGNCGFSVRLKHHVYATFVVKLSPALIR